MKLHRIPKRLKTHLRARMAITLRCWRMKHWLDALGVDLRDLPKP